MTRLGLLLVLLLGLLLPGQVGHAAAPHYSVAAHLPANQIDRQVSYFALRVTPGSHQALTITITNQKHQAQRYRLTVNRAATNTNGAVDYTHHGLARPASLQADIEQMASVPKTVTVPASATKAVTVQLRVPTKPFAGVALGGIRVTQRSGEATPSHKGLHLTNQFAYVLGLAVQEDADYKTIAPKLTLRRVTARQLNYRNDIVVELANTKPNLIHQLRLRVKVLKKGQVQPYITATKAGLALAPNSDFTLPISTGNQPLRAGAYTLVLAADAKEGGYHWQFRRHFTITAATARHLNHTAVAQHQPKGARIVTGLVLVIGILVVVLVAILGLMRGEHRRRRKIIK